MRAAVREDQAVHTELTIVRFIAKITAVGIANASVVEGFADGLIRPVPDKTALQARIVAKGLPVIGKIAEAVAHRVGVFAEDQRSLLARHTDPLFDPPFWHRWNQLVALNASVHRADNIGGGAVGAAAFILHRAGRVVALQPVIHRFMVAAAAGFISQRPDNNRRVVAVALQHSADAGAEGREPGRIVGKTIHRHHAVGFNISFVNDVQAIAVAQPIPARSVWIVRAAHGVEVVLLHQQNVLHHVLFGHHLAALVVMLVAVDAADQQRFAVQQQQAVFDFNAAKADIPGFRLDRFIAAPQGDDRPIAVWRFRAPQRRFFYRQTNRRAFGIVSALIDNRRTRRLAVAGDQTILIPQLNLHRQLFQLRDRRGNA